MPMRFSPDTCDCDIIVDNKTFVFIDWINLCELHKDETNLTIVNTILDHNNPFNKSNKPEKQKKIDKANERSRIKKLGKGKGNENLKKIN